MSKNKLLIRKKLLSANRSMLHILDRTKPTLAFYEHVILPLEIFITKAGDYNLCPSLKNDLEKAKEMFFTEEEKNDPQKSKRLIRDAVGAYISQGFTIQEFFLYGLRDVGYWEKREFLSDKERKTMLDKVNNQAAFHELTDKGLLYKVAKKYFKREACIISPEEDAGGFMDFITRHPTFIIKPIEGSTGIDTHLLTIKSSTEAEEKYTELCRQGKWIAEELIQQHPAMAEWNASSVNTLRVPTIDTGNDIKILQPFFRTGRKGSFVDNAGQGGVFAVFDPDTGIIITDGVDEYGGRHEYHPESGLKYKGWQIPRYQEMKDMTAEIIKELPSQPRYVAFDFALTPEGWVLVEGNYNGQFVGQIAEKKGVRKKFIEYYCR